MEFKVVAIRKSIIYFPLLRHLFDLFPLSGRAGSWDKAHMGHVCPFFYRKFFIPDGLGFWPDGDIFPEAFQLFKISAVYEFIVFEVGGGEEEHGAKLRNARKREEGKVKSEE